MFEIIWKTVAGLIVVSGLMVFLSLGLLWVSTPVHQCNEEPGDGMQKYLDDAEEREQREAKD